jgi:hypothetical protein
MREKEHSDNYTRPAGRNEHAEVSENRHNAESAEGAAMAPSVYYQTSRPGVHGSKECLESIEKSYQKGRSTESLQITGQESHPHLLTGADQHDG